MKLLTGAILGAAAGAAGTTALNLVTYVDMALRGRPTSDTPEQTVEALAETAHVHIPGEGDVRKNRIAGLGPLTGIAAGLGVGTLLGVLRAAGGRAPLVVSSAITGLAAMAATDGSMTALGVTDPRAWKGKDWFADAVPHLAYGLVTAAVLDRLAG